VRKVPSNIFSNTSHLFDRSCLNDHRLQLIKIIINKNILSQGVHIMAILKMQMSKGSEINSQN